MTSDPLISVVIVTWNGRQYLEACLTAVAAQVGVRIETMRLENQTTLSWRANPEPGIAGYEIVWRETTAPFWQGAEFVGNVTRASVPMSKDDYLFSVRAVGGGGQRSLATYPLTLRNPQAAPAK